MEQIPGLKFVCFMADKTDTRTELKVYCCRYVTLGDYDYIYSIGGQVDEKMSPSFK